MKIYTFKFPCPSSDSGMDVVIAVGADDDAVNVMVRKQLMAARPDDWKVMWERQEEYECREVTSEMAVVYHDIETTVAR